MALASLLLISTALALSSPSPATSPQSPPQEPAKAAAPRLEMTRREKREGFVALAGADFRGYKKQAGLPSAWRFEGGILSLTPGSGSGGDVVTLEQYEDFDFRFYWNIAPGGNSGIMVRATEEGFAAWNTGSEYQLLDNATHPDGRSPLTSAGSIYALIAPSKDVCRKAGEWNEGRIVMRKGKLQHYLNGTMVAEADWNSPEWAALVAKSKFRGMPYFSKREKGHLVIQDHGNLVQLANLRVRKL